MGSEPNNEIGVRVLFPPEYAFEELVAELASSFMCSKLGISGQIENHSNYISSWIKLLKEDDKALFRLRLNCFAFTKHIYCDKGIRYGKK